MSLDLTLEENDAMEYVKGRVVELPSLLKSGRVVALLKSRIEHVLANLIYGTMLYE